MKSVAAWGLGLFIWMNAATGAIHDLEKRVQHRLRRFWRCQDSLRLARQRRRWS